ncbi:membrane protein, partial [sediment metagenome]
MCALGYGAFQASHYLEGFKQYGALGAFIVSFIASTSIFFPVFGFVVIGAIAASDASNWALVALGSASGSALGQFTAYLAGYGG